MRLLLVLTSVLALASSAVASPGDLTPPREPSQRDAQLIRASLECQDEGLGANFGSCPTKLNQCKSDCYIENAEDILRCMSGSSGILPSQRENCYSKANAIYAQCLKNCNSIWG